MNPSIQHGIHIIKGLLINVPVRHTTWYARFKAGKYPKPIRQLEGVSVWPTAYTTLVTPGIRDKEDPTGNELWGRCFEVFGFNPGLIRGLIARYPSHLEWLEVLELLGCELAEMMDYPSSTNDQQPFDMHHTCPLWLSPDFYETPADHEFAMRLYWLWAWSIIHHCKGKDIDTTNLYIRFMNVRLEHLFMEDTEESAFRLNNSIDWLNQLRIQHGLHDIPSGQLIEREEYTLRQLVLDSSGFVGKGRLITGGMLNTAGLKARLFSQGKPERPSSENRVTSE